MKKPRLLPEKDVYSALAVLPDWRWIGGKLHREFRFPDFTYAFGFMAAAAVVIAESNHHPEWSNAWNLVTVDLATHDAGGVTSLDLALAGKLEALAQRLLK